MKKMLAVAVLLLASAAAVNAKEFPANPDRFPSVGITLAGAAESGDVRTFGGGASATQSANASHGAFTLDLRLPMSDNVTLSGSISSLRSSFEAPETSMLFGQESETNGAGFSVGVRFYIK